MGTERHGRLATSRGWVFTTKSERWGQGGDIAYEEIVELENRIGEVEVLVVVGITRVEAGLADRREELWILKQANQHRDRVRYVGPTVLIAVSAVEGGYCGKPT